MRFVKLFIISIVVISVVLIALSLMLPSHVRISRAIDINAPVESIRPNLTNLENWPKWNALLADSSLTTVSVNSDHIKTNRFDIYASASVRRDSVSTRWAQPDGREFTGNFSMLGGDSTTVVQWYFDFYLRWYPWEKFGSIIYDERMGPGMEKSLAQLKTLVETSH